MTYVGERLKTMTEGDDPSLVDPECSVGNAPSFDINALGGLCSYRGFSDHQRLAYLNWLAAGRISPSVPRDFLLVFFYGLERRVMIDSARQQEARQEWFQIVLELRRLLALHNRNPGAFQEKALCLLNWLELADDPPKIYEQEFTDPEVMKRPLRLQFALSQVARDREAMPAWLALCLVRNDPGISLRSTATKCADLFDLHFKRRYLAAFEEGIFLRKSATPLEFRYFPASPALSMTEGVVLAFGDMKEADTGAVVLNKLQKVVDETLADLDGYARAIGPDSEKVGCFEAMINLPVSLWREDPIADRELNILLDGLKDGPVLTTLSDALVRFGNGEKQPVREKLRTWVRAMEGFGIGFTPDLMLQSKPVALADPVAFFKLGNLQQAERSTPRALAVLAIIDVAMTVAMADTEFTDKAVECLMLRAHELEGVGEGMWTWLDAYARCTQRKPGTLTSLKKRIAECPAMDKEAIATLALKSLEHQREISPAQMRSLEKLHVALSLDNKNLFDRVHAMATGSSIQHPNGKPAEFSLDASRIEELHRDTATVSTLLATIFRDEDSAPPLEVEKPAVDGVLGLDAKHSAMAQLLLTRSQWPLDDIKALAREHGLFVDGALENLNEAAFDAHGIPFTEGDDPVDINPEILELLS